MSDKLTSSHLRRLGYIYIRQSTLTQMQRNRESAARQHRLVERATQLGWRADQVLTIDEDQGLSGSGTAHRKGFEFMTSEVALVRVGLILAIEVSRLSRNNADWYRLLVGLKGTMSEAELHVIRARLNNGIWNKAARGELRRALPVGFVWGEEEGQILFDPDEAVRQAIHTVFQKFAEIGSVRQLWIWLCTQKLLLPNRRYLGSDLRWIAPTYHAVRTILDNLVYAGVCRYGRTRQERYIDADTYEMNRQRIAANSRPTHHQAGGAIREGAALLQGLASCGRCGRKLKVIYQGQNCTSGCECRGTVLVNGRAQGCLRIGGVRIDRAVADAFLDAITPAGIDAAVAAEREIEANRQEALAQCSLQVECVHSRSPTCNAHSCGRSARTSGRCGRSQPLRIATARRCYTRFWRRFRSACSGTPSQPT